MEDSSTETVVNRLVKKPLVPCRYQECVCYHSWQNISQSHCSCESHLHQNSQGFSVTLAFRPTNGDPVNFTSHLGNSSFVSDSRKNRTCVSHLLFCYFEIEMASLSRIKNYVKQDLLTSLFKFFS